MKDLHINSNHTMFIVPVYEHEISFITLEQSSRVSSGHDEFSSDMLTNTVNYFLTPLVHIINSSITSGIILKDMEIARVTLVFKVDDRTKMSNYRSISKLTFCFKNLGKLSGSIQYVEIGVTFHILVICGVPQGSVLGTLLFLTYVIDLQLCCNLSRFILFAGDTNLFFSDKNFDYCHQ